MLEITNEAVMCMKTNRTTTICRPKMATFLHDSAESSDILCKHRRILREPWAFLSRFERWGLGGCTARLKRGNSMGITNLPLSVTLRRCGTVDDQKSTREDAKMKVHPAICMKTKDLKSRIHRIRRYCRKIRYLADSSQHIIENKGQASRGPIVIPELSSFAETWLTYSQTIVLTLGTATIYRKTAL
jgi:hypothetical protein